MNKNKEGNQRKWSQLVHCGATVASVPSSAVVYVVGPIPSARQRSGTPPETVPGQVQFCGGSIANTRQENVSPHSICEPDIYCKQSLAI